MKKNLYGVNMVFQMIVILLIVSCKKIDEERLRPLEEARGLPQVTVPVWGDYTASSDPIKYFNVTGSPLHKAYPTFVDSFAYDLNLQSNREQSLPVLSPFSGTVTTLGTTFPGTISGGTYGAVLIDCGSGIYVGFMHMNNIKVKNGDKVTAGQQIGSISSVGASGVIHLHFAYYIKDKSGILRSKTVTFIDRPFNIQLKWKAITVLKANISNQIIGIIPFTNESIESATYYNNTFWSSDNISIAKVDGNGKVTGVKVGSTSVRVKFSGKEFSIPVVVK